MTYKRPEKKVSDILHDDSTHLGVMLKKVFQYNQLELKLADFISPDVAGHVQLGAYQKGVLLLLVDSGSWATKLSYMVPDLRDKLRSHPHWRGLKNIQVKVAPHLGKPKPSTPQVIKPVTISTQSQQSLKDAADNLADTDENQPLKQVLLRLAGA